MLGAVPGEAALGRGPAPDGDYARHDYHHPAAGWGAARSVASVLKHAGEPLEGFRALFVMNHENGGFDCPGCAWPDDPSGLKLDICESGVKHVTWELAPAKADRGFFAEHSVGELAGWSDHALEAAGRLAEPMSYDPASDKYEPISWEDAFALVGETLRGLESPHQASFYTSGRLSNEATFLYQLWVREFGTNNLPDCSNMCHEASGRALTATLGSGKGTVDLRDWEAADAIWLMGENAATNAPRMLTWLAEADRRGAQLVHINPLIEAASRRTIVPHEFVDMATFHTTEIGTMSVQVRIGGDLALLRGVAKAVFEAAEKDPDVLERDFIERYTHGIDDYRALVEATSWADLVEGSGIAEPEIRKLARLLHRVGARDRRLVFGRHPARARRRHGARDCSTCCFARKHRPRGSRPVPGPRAQQRAGQPHLRRQPPSDARVPRPARRGLRDRPAARARIGHRGHDRGDAARRRQGLRRPRRQLRACGSRPPLHGRCASELRADRPGEHEAQPQPRRPRRAGAGPALPRSQRQGSPGERRAGGDGRGRDVDGAHLLRDEGARLPAPALGVRDPRRHGQGDVARQQDAVGGVRRGLRPDSRHDGQSARGIRGLQRPRAPSARLSDRAARAGARFRDAVRSGRVLGPPPARRRRPGRWSARAGDDPLTRPVHHDDLLERRSLPRPQGPAHGRVHERGRHARQRPGPVRPRRRHELLEGRTERAVHGYRAVRFEIPRGCAAG